MVAVKIKNCPKCGKWTESSIPMAAGTGCSCKGHWDQLTPQQQADVTALRERLGCQLIDATEAFHREHPELRLTWNFTLDALLIKGED